MPTPRRGQGSALLWGCLLGGGALLLAGPAGADPAGTDKVPAPARPLPASAVEKVQGGLPPAPTLPADPAPATRPGPAAPPPAAETLPPAAGAFPPPPPEPPPPDASALPPAAGAFSPPPAEPPPDASALPPTAGAFPPPPAGPPPADTTAPPPAQPGPPPVAAAAPPAEPFTVEHPQVLDTARLASGQLLVTLYGVLGLPGEAAQGLQGFLAASGDRVTCQALAAGDFVCLLPDGTDVAEAALVNGAARVRDDAPPSYRAQEAAAQAARRGLWSSLPPPPVVLKHPLVQDTATLVADRQAFVLDGLQGLGAPYAGQMQGYIATNGDMVTCNAQPLGGTYICVLNDGTDLAKVALVNGAALVGQDAPDAYRVQQREALLNQRGYWLHPPPEAVAVATTLVEQPAECCVFVAGDDGVDGIAYVGGVPTAVIEGETVFLVFAGVAGWGYYDHWHSWHGAPPGYRAHLEHFHPDGRGLRGYDRGPGHGGGGGPGGGGPGGGGPGGRAGGPGGGAGPGGGHAGTMVGGAGGHGGGPGGGAATGGHAGGAGAGGRPGGAGPGGHPGAMAGGTGPGGRPGGMAGGAGPGGRPGGMAGGMGQGGHPGGMAGGMGSGGRPGGMPGGAGQGGHPGGMAGGMGSGGHPGGFAGGFVRPQASAGGFNPGGGGGHAAPSVHVGGGGGGGGGGGKRH